MKLKSLKLFAIGMLVFGISNGLSAQTKKAPVKKNVTTKTPVKSSNTTKTSTSATSKPSLKIGQEYQGGIIVILNSDGKSGVVAALSNLDNSMNWADANKACQDLVANGYDDWRLPTAKELAAIYYKLHSENKGSVAKGTYLSSDVMPGDLFAYAYIMQGMTGVQNVVEKTSLNLVRPVRTFK